MKEKGDRRIRVENYAFRVIDLGEEGKQKRKDQGF